MNVQPTVYINVLEGRLSAATIEAARGAAGAVQLAEENEQLKAQVQSLQERLFAYEGDAPGPVEVAAAEHSETPTASGATA